MYCLILIIFSYIIIICDNILTYIYKNISTELKANVSA